MGKKNDVRQSLTLSNGTVQRIAEGAVRPIPRKTRVTRVTTVTDMIEEYKIPKAVMEVALELAQGDISRIKVGKDGSVTVVNQSRKTEGFR